MSPRSLSCSGRRLRLPGDPVNIEKFAVVGEIFPAVMAVPVDVVLWWPKDPELRDILDSVIVGDGGDLECVENASGARPSSWRSIDIVLGGTGKIDEVVLKRLGGDGT